MGTLSFRQPRLVALALLVIVAAGASALLAIGRQEDPSITNLFASVTTAFPGAGPERVEALVTAELEEALREISEVDVLSSVSATGISIIQVELLETLEAGRIEQVWSEVRDGLGEVALPAGAGVPEVDSDGVTAYSAIVALTAAHDDVPMTLMGRYGEALAERLRGVPGTKLVEVFGQPEEEITVTLDTAQAAALGLTAEAVAAQIAQADTKVAAGRMTGSGDDLVLEVTGEIRTLDRLRGMVLREGPQGATLRLGDVATLDRGPRQPLAEAALHDGRPAVLVAAVLNEGLQIDAWSGLLRDELADFAPLVPGGLTMELIFDQATYTADRLAEVGGNMALGVALVLAVLLVTLGLRAALIVAIILPVVTLATLFTMNLIGLPIHQMSVTGLIVALGLLVDAGIVMTDEIGRRLRAGAGRAAAVGASVHRLTMPLFASTVTTALGFTPMILLPGPAGDFVGSIAIAVVVMLLWSFVVAVTITPALAGWTMPLTDRGGLLARGIPSGALGRAFAASLRWAARNPVRSIALTLVLPIMGFASLPLLTAQFFPGVDRDQFHVEIDLPAGTGITRTQASVAKLDAALRATDGIETVSWTIGRSARPSITTSPAGARRRRAMPRRWCAPTGPRRPRRCCRSCSAVCPRWPPKRRCWCAGWCRAHPSTRRWSCGWSAMTWRRCVPPAKSCA